MFPKCFLDSQINPAPDLLQGALWRLLPDAEMGEDVAEYVVGVHGASDFTEVVKSLSCVHRYEVSRDAVAESVAHGLERGLG